STAGAKVASPLRDEAARTCGSARAAGRHSSVSGDARRRLELKSWARYGRRGDVNRWEGFEMAIGPVQLIVLGFDEPEFHGEIIDELERLRASDTVRVVDALAVYKDAKGQI